MVRELGGPRRTSHATWSGPGAGVSWRGIPMVQQGRTRPTARLSVLIVLVLSLGLSGAVSGAATARGSHHGTRGEDPGSYSNPLRPRIPGDGVVESCADPTVIHGQQPGDTTWYMYCTTDPLNDEDLDAAGNL